MFDVIVIGNITEDIIHWKEGEGTIISHKALGGSATYSSFCLRELGAKVGIAGRVRRDLPWLEEFRGIDLDGIEFGDATTTFELSYVKGEREVKILSDAGKIEHIPKEYFETKGVIFGPVFNEVSPSLMAKFSSLKAIDLQGVLRRKGPNNRIKHYLPAHLDEFLDVDVVKIGGGEMGAIGDYSEVCKRLSSRDAVLLTFGPRGSVVYDRSSNQLKKIPAFKTKTIDETGSGDTYLSAFFYWYLKTRDLIRSAYFASAAASFVVEDVGPRRFGNLEEVNERARALQEAGNEGFDHSCW